MVAVTVNAGFAYERSVSKVGDHQGYLCLCVWPLHRITVKRHTKKAPGLSLKNLQETGHDGKLG